MKTESPNQDPLADAAQALEHAMADAQRAIAAARAAPAPVVFALAESQKKCAALKIKIVALEELGSRQRQELATAALNADRAAKEHDRYKAKMTREQLTERVAWSADRIGLVASRDALKMQVDALEADRERLRQERDKFAAQAQAANDKRRETVANFKCSVDSLQRQVSRHEDAVEPAKAALVTVPAFGAPRKRRRTPDDGPEITTTRHGRRIVNRPYLEPGSADEELPRYEFRRSRRFTRRSSVETDSA